MTEYTHTHTQNDANNSNAVQHIYSVFWFSRLNCQRRMTSTNTQISKCNISIWNFQSSFIYQSVHTAVKTLCRQMFNIEIVSGNLNECQLTFIFAFHLIIASNWREFQKDGEYMGRFICTQQIFKISQHISEIFEKCRYFGHNGTQWDIIETIIGNSTCLKNYQQTKNLTYVFELIAAPENYIWKQRSCWLYEKFLCKSHTFRHGTWTTNEKNLSLSSF